MEDRLYKERLKGFYIYDLAMQAWNENMKTINKYLKGLNYWEGNMKFK